jgi:hypothetical protein
MIKIDSHTGRCFLLCLALDSTTDLCSLHDLVVSFHQIDLLMINMKILIFVLFVRYFAILIISVFVIFIPNLVVVTF